jgi:hypothetical protein
MSDLTNASYVTTAPGRGGANLVVQEYTDLDLKVKTLPVSTMMWGTNGGEFFLANESTPLPVAFSGTVDVNMSDGAGNNLISATAAPGSSDRGLVVRVAGAVNQGTAIAVGSAWPMKITDGTDTATFTTISAKKALDVNIVDGAGNGSNLTDKGAFVTGTTAMTVMGGIYLASRDTLSDATGAAAAMTPKRAIYTSLETPAGDSCLSETYNAVVECSAFPAAVTATLAATGPTASTACSGLATVAVTLSGTCTSLSGTWQVSDGGTNWYDVYAVRRDTNAADAGPSALAMSSENLAWQIDVAGYTHFRFNVTELTTYGVLSYKSQAIASPFTNNPSSGGGGSGGTSIVDAATFTTGTTEVTPAGGLYRSSRRTVTDGKSAALAMTSKQALLVSLETIAGDSVSDDTDDALKVVSPDNSISSIVSASGTNLTTVKNAAGVLCGYSFMNATASPIYLKFFDNASPTVGSTAPKLVVMIPASSGVNSPSTDMKIQFATAIKFCLVTGAATADSTGIAANDVVGFAIYR